MTNIRQATARLLRDDFQINESVTAMLFERGILQEPSAKKVLIRDEYIKLARPKEKQRLRSKLADKYCVSVSLVEKIVHQ